MALQGLVSGLGDALGVPKSPHARWALAVGAPAACYLVLRWAYGAKAADDDRTDFDGFLKRVEAVGSTGHVAVAAGPAARSSGPIDSFFRDAGADEDTRNPVDFDSFIKKPKAANGPAAAAAKGGSAKPAAKQPKPEQAQVLVMYGTEYGFSKEIAEKLCSQMEATGKYW